MRCACNFVSAWKAPWWSCVLQTQSCARKALNQTQTGTGRGSWAPSYQLCPTVLPPALGSLCYCFLIIFYNLQVYAISTSSCSSHQQRCWYNFQRKTRDTTVTLPWQHFSQSQDRFIGFCYLAQPIFFFPSQMRVILLKFPGMDTGILVAKIPIRYIGEASVCISSYLGHSTTSQEHQSAAWCAQDLYNTTLDILYFGQLSVKKFLFQEHRKQWRNWQ